MYNFMLFFLYEAIKRRNPDAKFYAVSMVALALMIHLLFLLTIIEYFFGIDHFLITNFSTNYGENRLYFSLWALGFLVLVHLFYNNKRFKNIIENYQKKYEGKKVLTFFNWFKYLILLIVPVVVIALLSS